MNQPGGPPAWTTVLGKRIMKKTLVAAGVIVALGVVWTGAAWFTGKQFESRLAEMVAKSNADLKRTSPESGLELAYQNYHRGVFSSQLELVVKPIQGAQSSWLKPGQTVVLNEDVDHGPFPFAQLKKFNLIPSLASVNSTLANNETTKALFETTKGKSLFTADTRVGYSGATATDITLVPVNYQKETDKIAFSGGEFSIDVDGKGSDMSLTGQIDSALIDSVNEYGQRVQLTLNNLQTDGSSELTASEERIGQQKLSLDKLAMSVEGKEMAVFEGTQLTAKTEMAEDKKHLNSAVDYTLDNLKVQNQNMGSGKLSLKVGQIDGKAWRQFSQQYNAQANALLAQPEVMQNPQAYQENFRQILLNNLPLLLDSGPVITLAPFSWKNAKGESSLNLSLFFKNKEELKQPVNSLGEELLRNVKSLDGKLSIPMDMATEFMTQVAQLEGYQKDQAEKLARKQVEGAAAAGQMFRVVTTKDNTISSSLQYANGQVNLNGDKMPVEELFGKFTLPGMGAEAPAPELEAPMAPAPRGPMLAPQ